MRSFFAVVALALCVTADVYMHNMRGSNDRLNENNQDRNNANRLFDSQNNNRGGYNVGDMNAAQDGLGVMQYYSSSNLMIEWTNQHGGGPNPNVNSAIILQYMCNDVTTPYDNTNLRDGTSTTTVTNDNQNSGRHETMQYYTDCTTRSRNFGLFVADQILQGKSAIYTRQNPNGDRHGYECPEERDYYPYWAPTPWRDIAIITSNTTLCNLYQAQSQNVVPKYYCTGFTTTTNAPVVPIDSADCTAGGGTWTSAPAFGIPAPDCVAMGWSRDNHLGNTVGGQPLNYNWVIPSMPQVAGSAPICVLRMRYNISTNDYDGWNTFASSNGAKSPVQTDPDVNFGEGQHVIVVKLAINTNQYGRTFQDRSHTFTVLPRPAQATSGNIYNLNVRDRRGNIVQVYPAVEYDFIPNRLTMGTADWVHIQWTGSLNTPDGAGQGTPSTDRSNIVCLANPSLNYPMRFNNTACDLFTNLSDQERFASVGLTSAGTGTGTITFDPLLNDRPAYYNGGLMKPGGGAPGTYNYMCTRNNNFSNRSQKGWITVA